MKHLKLSGAYALSLLTAVPAWAAMGQIDGFGASATTVTVGTTVDFSVSYSIFANSYQSGGSDPVEPAPIEGYQEWHINWYYTDYETVSGVQVELGGNTQHDFPTLEPGSSHSGSMSFSILFDTVGSFDLSPSGGWTASGQIYTSNESAWRNCWYEDPDQPVALICDSWTYQYYDYDDYYSSDGSFAWGSPLTITVTAVPEPQTLALWALGLAALGGVAARSGRLLRLQSA